MIMNEVSLCIHDDTEHTLHCIADIAQAHDLADMQRRCALAIAAILPDSMFDLVWNIALPLTPPVDHSQLVSPVPETDDLLKLYAGEIIEPRPGHPGYLPLRLSGTLRGWLRITSGPWSIRQKQALYMLAAIVAPLLVTLDSPAQDEFITARQILISAAHRLRGIIQVEVLLEQIYRITQSLIGTSNFFLALCAEGSNWLELAYLVEHGKRQEIRQFWRQNAGLSGAVVSSGTPICTADYTHECEQRGIPAIFIEGTSIVYAWLGVPLVVSDQVIGTLVVFETDPDPTYTNLHTQLLQELASEAAIAIQNALLFARAERQRRQLVMLNHISHSITSTLDPEQVPSLIMRQVQELLEIEEGSLLLVNEPDGDLVFSYACGPAGQRLLGQRLPHGVGIAGYVFTSGQSALVNDTSSDGRFYPATDSKTGFVTRSLLAVPLRGIGGIQGVIEVMNKRSGAPFFEEDRLLLTAVADQAVIALENARRFAQVDQALARRARELDRINQQLREIVRVGNALRAEHHLDELLHQIAQAACQTTGFRSVIIMLVEQQHSQHPYLRRVVAAGPAATALERTGDTQVPLERLHTIVRPEFCRGSVTYFIDHRYADYMALWGLPKTHDTPDLLPPAPGSWHAHDMLFSLLRDRQGKLLGLLRVEEPEDGMQPSPEQIQILEIFANQASVAIENAHLYAEQQHSLNSMIALNGLGIAINTTLRSEEQIFEMTASGMMETTSAQRAVVLLFDKQPDSGLSSETTGLHITLCLGPPLNHDESFLIDLAYQALRHERPVSNQLSLTSATGRSHLSPPLQETWVMIPLCLTRQTLGVIGISYTDGLPSAANLETLTLFASQAAVAVEGVRLFSAVRQGRDQLASIMASTHEGIVLITQDGHMAVMNNAFRQLTGCDAQERIEHLSLEAFLNTWANRTTYTEDEWQALHAGLYAVSTGAEMVVQGQLGQSTATSRALEWTVLYVTGADADNAPPPHRHAGHMNAENGDRNHSTSTAPLLLVLRDITTARETERMRQDLTSMIVHDLRSPMTSIMTSIDMIFKGFLGEITPKQREVLSIALSSAEHLLHMVNLMLDINRLEGGSMPLERTALQADQLVQQVVERLEAIAYEKAIRINVDYDNGLPLIYADKELIARVLQNLLDNAIKFSPYASQIVVTISGPIDPHDLTTDCQTVTTENPMTVRPTPQHQVTFKVRDHGAGIPPNDQHKIFAKFTQAGQTRSRGTGLGLTFCKLAVEAHGGQIWVESVPGEGSTFFFTLPIATTTTMT